MLAVSLSTPNEIAGQSPLLELDATDRTSHRSMSTSADALAYLRRLQRVHGSMKNASKCENLRKMPRHTPQTGKAAPFPYSPTQIVFHRGTPSTWNTHSGHGGY